MKTLLQLVVILSILPGICLASAAIDCGDVPDVYGTLLGNSGPYHLLGYSFWLGEAVDIDIDGQPSVLADGDDMDGFDDEDGVLLPSEFVIGGTASIIIHGGPTGGLLDAWIDFGQDNTFDLGDQIAASYVLTPGLNAVPLSVSVPSDAVRGETYARFRLSSTGGLTPNDGAPDGEVEDYRINIVPEPMAVVLLGLGSVVLIKRRKH